MRRNPGAAGDYIRLRKAERERVDRLFIADRRLKANEVTSLVEDLTEKRLAERRVGDLRRKALSNMRARLSEREYFNDISVEDNVKKMRQRDLKVAATASVEQLIDRARVQAEGNLFWYH
jgi:hypothetical protein